MKTNLRSTNAAAAVREKVQMRILGMSCPKQIDLMPNQHLMMKILNKRARLTFSFQAHGTQLFKSIDG